MTTILTGLHVIAAILFLGPITVASATFHIRAYDAHKGNALALGSAKTLYKISQSYGILSLLVPMLGVAVMLLDRSFLKDGRFHIAIALAAIAWAILFFVILPRQKKMAGALELLEADEQTEGNWEIANWDKAKTQLSIASGVFALLWVITFVLMIIPAW